MVQIMRKYLIADCPRPVKGRALYRVTELFIEILTLLLKVMPSLLTDDLDVIERAAVLGAQSILGQICDPIDGAGQVPCFLRNITAVPTAIACANAALAGCETLISLDEMAETLLRVGKKLKMVGLNDLGVCYYRMQQDQQHACPGCGK